MAEKPTYEALEKKIKVLERRIAGQEQADKGHEGIEQKYRKLFEGLNEAVYRMFLPGGTYEYVSPGFQQVFGYSQNEFLSTPLFIRDIMHPEFRDYFEEKWKDLLKGTVPSHYEYKIFDAQGNERWILQSNRPTFDQEGTITAIEGVCQNITERKEMQKELQRSEEKYRLLVENANEGIAVTQDGTLKFANPKMKAFAGYSEQELTSQPFARFIHPDDLEMVMKYHRLRLEGAGAPETYDFRIITKSGDVKWLENKGVSINWEEKSATLNSLSDITDRKTAEGLLQENEARLRFCLDGSGDGTWEGDLGMSTLFLSERAKEILGVDHRKRGFQRSDLVDLIPSDYLDYVDNTMREMREGARESYEMELPIEGGDGTRRWMLSRGRVFTWTKEGKPEKLFGTVSDVTERKQMEEALRESEAQYRGIFNAATDAFFIFDSKGSLKEVNPQACALYGYPHEDLLRLSGKDFVHPDYYHLHEEFFRDVPKGKRFHVESVEVRKDGSFFDADIKGTQFDYKGEKHLLAIVRDITESKRAREGLRESEKRYRDLVDNANSIILHWDAEGRIVYMNPYGLDFYGYCEEELIGRNVVGTIVPEAESETGRHLSAMMKDIQKDPGKHKHNENENMRKDGSRVWVAWTNKAITDEEGFPIEILSVGNDITERKRGEEKLKASEKRYRELYEGSRDGYALVDMEGKILESNSAFREMLGYTEEELQEKTYEEITPEKWHSEEAEIIREHVFERGYSDVFEKEYIRKDGTVFPIEIRTNLVEDESGEPVSMWAYVRDITERNKVEEERRKLERQLQQSQKMHAIGTLAGGIAHDFNNILGGIIAYTELGLYSLTEEDQTHRNLQQVLKASDRAKDLVKQILAFSRHDEHERRPISVRPIVKESIKLLRASLPSTIKIRQNVRSISDTVIADSTQIHQVMMNLCTNGAHAMAEEGGTLTIKLEDQVLDAHSASRYPNLSPGTYVKLTVGDTGHGMEREILDRIFDPYFTTKEKGVGTGLGLAVVDGIVASHGGTITVESDPGEGSIFQVLFPTVDSSEIEEGVSPELFPTGDEQILFVDDEETLVDAGEQMLQRLGYTVVSTTSSLEALRLFRAKPESFDLIITDMTMPDMTGEKLAQEAMNIRADIPVVLCTGYSERITEDRAKKMGIRAFTMKPISMHDLAMTIREVLDIAFLQR